MARGRPKKPPEMHLAEGTYREDRHGAAGTPTPSGEPVMPQDLDAIARELWVAIVPQLVDIGVATDIDTLYLGEMCRWYSQYRKAAKNRREKAYRRIVMQQMAWKVVDSIGSRFGLTPSDRARLRVEPKDTDDPLLKMMGG